MAIDVKFANAFGKRRNSTKRPADLQLGAYAYSGEIVEPVDILHPAITFDLPPDTPGGKIVTSLNYAYIPKFFRYYYVTGWTFDRGLWTCTMEVDALATYKVNIGGVSAFVERSNSQTMSLTDGLYPALCVPDNAVVPMTSNTYLALGFGSSYGCYIVGIVNSDSNSVGCTSYYMFKNEGFRAFCNKLLGNIDWASAGIDEISAPLLKALFNPMQYITSCVWLPFCPYDNDDFKQITLPFGWWQFTATAIKLTVFTSQFVYEGTVSKHPYISTFGTYMNYSPYTRVTLHWGPLGDMPIDTSVFGSGNNVIRLRCSVDFVTGKAVYQISRYDADSTPQNRIMQTGTMQIGVNVSVAQSSFNVFDTARSMVAIANGTANVAMGSAKVGATAGVAALTGGADQIISGATTIANGVIDGLQSIMPQISTSGANGCAVAYEDRPYISVQYFRPVGVAPEVNGYVTMRYEQISNLSGFIKCSNAQYNGPGMASEAATINAALNSGFYYE